MMAKLPEGGGFRGDNRDTAVESVDALTLLRQCVVDRSPQFKELPKLLTLDTPVPIMPECAGGNDSLEQSFYQASNILFDLQNAHHVEFGCAVVSNHEDKLAWGPCCQGDEDSVSIGAPLKETEITDPSGLFVCKFDKIVATMHSHPGLHSFSLQDFYADFTIGTKQLYVIKENGVLDMAQITHDTRLVSEDAFRRLLSLWDSYLLPNGEFRPDLGSEEYSEFLHRISDSVLKIGFYSNHDSADPGVLKLMEWKK